MSPYLWHSWQCCDDSWHPPSRVTPPWLRRVSGNIRPDTGHWPRVNIMLSVTHHPQLRSLTLIPSQILEASNLFQLRMEPDHFKVSALTMFFILNSEMKSTIKFYRCDSLFLHTNEISTCNHKPTTFSHKTSENGPPKDSSKLKF